MNLRRSGIVRILVPPDCSSCGEFDRSRYWIRVRRASGFVDVEPRLRMVLLNTAMASQALTIVDEVLGSSTGTPGQKFRTTRAPVLEGLRVEVLETSRTGQPEWMMWRQVRTLLSSTPFDRHYVVDYLAGEITFGDNIYGAVPPAGKGNVRTREYRTGGGRRGNVARFTVTELRKAIKYIDRVTNYQPALGGADAETASSLLHSEPRRLRHRGYAVTAEDYEDLAREASAAVARAYCIPLYDLLSDPGRKRQRAGVVSLIVVPESDEPAASPSLELLDQVGKHLDQRRPPGAELVLLGPDYLSVRVKAEVVVTRLEVARRVERDAVRAVTDYLHTITGRSGSGWQVAVVPSRSELLTLLESIPDVSYVRSVEILTHPPSTEARGRFLIYPGDVAITADLER
jgi:predicted phage baseplate assembly protein